MHRACQSLFITHMQAQGTGRPFMQTTASSSMMAFTCGQVPQPPHIRFSCGAHLDSMRARAARRHAGRLQRPANNSHARKLSALTLVRARGIPGILRLGRGRPGELGGRALRVRPGAALSLKRKTKPKRGMPGILCHGRGRPGALGGRARRVRSGAARAARLRGGGLQGPAQARARGVRVGRGAGHAGRAGGARAGQRHSFIVFGYRVQVQALCKYKDACECRAGKY